MTNKQIKEIKEDVETLENVFSALVDVLEKKKVIFDKELNEQIKKRLQKENKFRNLKIFD